MIRKIKYILLLLIILLAGIIALFLNNSKDNSLVNNDDNDVVPDHIIYDGESFYSDKFIEEHFGVKDLTDEEKELMIYYEKNIYEVLLKMMVKGNSWRCFPVDKSIKDRYDENKGMFPEYDFDTVEYSQNTLDDFVEYGDIGNVSIIGTKGKKKKIIYIKFSTNDGIEYLEIEKVLDYTDENGNELDIRMKCNMDNFDDYVWTIYQSKDEMNDYISTSKRFANKYLNLEDIISKNLIGLSDGYSVGYKSVDFDNKSAVYYWDSNKVRYLVNVKFIYDKNDSIDDVEVSIVGTE